ncbi:MAG: TRAP transporter large permease [Thermodesulfobacteriota bacterium]
MILVLAMILIILTILGLPIFAGIMAATMLGLYASQVDFAAILVEVFRLANAPVLLAVPLFTFAGYLLAEGGTSTRLIRFSKSLFGWIPGGLGVVALVSSAFFTAITGATGVTIIALGGLLLPALLSERYDGRFSLGLVATSGSIGIQFPPSLPIILYGFVSGASIEKLFVAGVLPGALMVGALCFFSVHIGKKWNLESPRFSFTEFLAAFREAIWEIPIPLLIIAGIYSGVTTATEASSLTALYVLFIKVVVFRELKPVKDLPRIAVASMKMVGGIMIVLGAALGFTNYLVDAFIPMKLLGLMEGWVQGRIGFLLVLNLLLLVVGCMMDIFSAILVVVPLILPLAQKYGVDPVHLGIVFISNLAIGYCTPPIGLSLFVASTRFDRPVLEVARATLPFLLLLLLTLLLITYWPGLSLVLPRILKT